MKRRVAVLLILTSPVFIPDAFALDPYLGTGWSMTRLDLELWVDSVPPGLIVDGTMTLRLDGDSSAGPTLWFNKRDEGMEWVELGGDGVARVEFGTAERYADAVRYAAVELESEAAKGDVITLDYRSRKVADSSQLVTSSEVALGSWVDAWYPVALVEGGLEELFSTEIISIPGTTVLNLPEDWIGFTDGSLVRREKVNNRNVEVWDLGGSPVARSFAAGPYETAERRVDGRSITISLLGEHVLGADRLAELLAAAMAAQEGRLGAFPFSGYGVIEVPDGISHWSAASQQTFIMATSSNFDHDHGNLPLWAHEMAHGWWGNTVNTKGPGSKMVDEALAQFGVLIGLEELEGLESMIEFLEFSRSGYSEMQCARGYFSLVDQGIDHPLATLGDSELSGGLTHILADSKGMWVYHMLRRRVGDEIFFATLRGLIESFDGREMSLDDLRLAFIAAAPDMSLEAFFSQWLDRVGAPSIDVSWSNVGDDRVALSFEQIQDSPPFDLAVDVELISEGGTTHRQNIRLSERKTIVEFSVPTGLARVEVDPDRDLLIWRPAYIETPLIDGVSRSAAAEWLVPEAYEGTYRVEKLGQTVTVSARRSGLWVRIGDGRRQLFPGEPHEFITKNKAALDFEVEGGVAASFILTLPNGVAAEGVRVQPLH